MPVDPRFIEGLRLFNRAEYFECHEVIEDLWLATPVEDPHRDLYKGVIQAAAAIYQFDRGILTGARGLYRTAVGYLSAYEPSALGLNVSKLIADLKRIFIPLEGWDGASSAARDRAFEAKAEYRV